MKDQLLLLCKRLRNATHDELLDFMEVEEDVLNSMLLYLINEGSIEDNDGCYRYVQTPRSTEQKKIKNLHLMFQYHSPETIDLIIKSFCLKLPSQKVCYLVNLSDTCIIQFYNEFRKLIYERQFKTLYNKFFAKPKIGRYRLFFEHYVYFYVYDNRVYVSEKLLRYNNEKNFDKSEIKEFKKIYSYLSRFDCHNKNAVNIHHKLAEGIWRREKEFQELYMDLKYNLLNIS